MIHHTKQQTLVKRGTVMHSGTEQVEDAPLVRIHLQRRVVINELPDLQMNDTPNSHILQCVLLHSLRHQVRYRLFSLHINGYEKMHRQHITIR